MIGFASSCGACKFLRRKCTNECVFAPYFCHEQGANHFAAVHKVFGASNVSKLLSHLPVHNRSEAAITISYEALARMRDPVYGCVAHIYALQQQVANLHEEIEFLETQVANLANDVSHQSCQETNETKNWFSSSSQQEAINVQHYLNQQPAQPSHTMNATGDLGLTDEMNVQLPPMNLLEDQNLFYDFTDGTNYLERFAMEMEQEISPSGPWLGNVTYAEY